VPPGLEHAKVTKPDTVLFAIGLVMLGLGIASAFVESKNNSADTLPTTTPFFIRVFISYLERPAYLRQSFRL